MHLDWLVDPLIALAGGAAGYLLRRYGIRLQIQPETPASPSTRVPLGIVLNAAVRHRCSKCRQMERKFIEFSDGTRECLRHR